MLNKRFTLSKLFFQTSDEKTAIEMSLIGEVDTKVDSEEFSDANDDQANYNGMRWIIICSSTVLVLYIFYWCFYNLFYDYIFIPIKCGSLISAVK